VWLRDRRHRERIVTMLRELEANSAMPAAAAVIVSTPLFAIWLIVRRGVDLSIPYVGSILLAGSVFIAAGGIGSLLVLFGSRLAIRIVNRRGRFQPIQGDRWAPTLCPDTLWCGRYGVLDGKVSLQLERWTNRGGWMVNDVGPPELADPDDPVAIGEARARLEIRASAQAGRDQSAELAMVLADERKGQAEAMVRALSG
jgi:hypothetical protein